MHLTPLNYLLWVSGPMLQAVIGIAMLRRRLVRECPWFFAYTIFHVFRVGAEFYVYHRMTQANYFWVYWVGQAISAMLGFAVIYEIYDRVFGRYDAIRRLGSLLFRWGAVALLIVAVVMAASNQGSETNRVVEAVISLERSVRVIQCGLLLLLFALSSFFGLSWRHYVFGMALGFGIFVSVEMAAITLRGYFGTTAREAWALANSAAYCCAILIWVGYFLAPQPAVKTVAKVPKYELEAWNRTLLELLNR